jgi:hypothetical protein
MVIDMLSDVLSEDRVGGSLNKEITLLLLDRKVFTFHGILILLKFQSKGGKPG